MQKTELKFNSQVCTTIEQSKRLLDLGLKSETADCMYSVMTKSYNEHYILEEDRQYNLILFRQEEVQSVGFSHYEHIPAWSLHRLKCLLPNKIPYESGYLTTEIINNVNLMFITDTSEQRVISFIHENLYESMIKYIKWLIKEDYFNKEYLKQ